MAHECANMKANKILNLIWVPKIRYSLQTTSLTWALHNELLKVTGEQKLVSSVYIESCFFCLLERKLPIDQINIYT